MFREGSSMKERQEKKLESILGFRFWTFILSIFEKGKDFPTFSNAENALLA